MRKGMMLVGVAALLTMAPMKAQAQNFSFGLLAGVSMPMGDYGEAVGLGPMGGVYGDFGVTPQFAIGADIIGNFHGMSSDLEDDLEAAGVTDFDFSFTVIQFGAHAKFRPAPSGLWLQGGLGMYSGSSTVEIGGAEFDESETKFGFNLGAGFDFGSSPTMKFGLLATWHNVPDAIAEFDDTGALTGDDTAAQYISIGAHVTFGTSGQ